MNSSMPATVFTIPEAHVFQVTGRDAARYLHARLSNNVRDLPIMRGCAAAGLSPQGRTEIFGTVLKISPEEFYFVCDGGNLESITTALLRYKVADRVDCRVITGVSLAHVSPVASLIGQQQLFAPLTSLPEYAPLRNETITTFRHIRSVEGGVDLFGPTAEVQQLIDQLTTSGAVILPRSEQLAARIRAHRPTFPGELNDRGIFLESGLAHAVSFTKGCYVGQEVLEKVDSHGRLPYVNVSLISSNQHGEIPAAESVVNVGSTEQAMVGEIIASTIDSASGKTLCFARVKSGTLTEEATYRVHNQEYRLL